MLLFVLFVQSSDAVVNGRLEDDRSTIKYLSEIARKTHLDLKAQHTVEGVPSPYLAIMLPFVASIFYGSEATGLGRSSRTCALSRCRTAIWSVYLAEAEAAGIANLSHFPPYLSG